MAEDAPHFEATATRRPPFRDNLLLAVLSREEREALQPDLEPELLEFKKVLYRAGQTMEHVWFVRRGVVSLTTTMTNGGIVEVATIGPEGFVGLPLLLNDDQMAGQCFVQVEGEGLRMTAAAFRRAIHRSSLLHELLMRYTLALIGQIAQSGACNRVHSIEQRCARWMLMTHDRVDADTFPLTQEFLGQMLGVRRPSVSVAAGMLQKAGLIHYTRGNVTIRDRAGLADTACECYGTIRDEFKRLIGTTMG